MGAIPGTLAYLFMIWGVITAVLVILVIYGNTLSIREDDEIYLNKIGGRHDGNRAASAGRQNEQSSKGDHSAGDHVGHLPPGKRKRLGVDRVIQIVKPPRSGRLRRDVFLMGSVQEEAHSHNSRRSLRPTKWYPSGDALLSETTMNQAILVRDWNVNDFHRRVLNFETLGYVARRETYRITPETNPGTGEVIHLYAIEMFLSDPS